MNQILYIPEIEDSDNTFHFDKINLQNAYNYAI